MSGFVRMLADPELVARFQKFCGVELVVDDQQTSTGYDQRPHAATSDFRGCGNGQATQPQQTSRADTGDARLRQHAQRLGNGIANNNNDDKNDSKVHANGVANGGGKNGYTQHQNHNNNHHHYPAASNGVGTTNHPTTTTSLCNGSNGVHPTSGLNGYPLAGSDDIKTTVSEEFLPHANGHLSAHTKCNEQEPNYETRDQPVSGGRGGKTATRVLIRYPALYYWSRVGATLGNEEFYLTVKPFLLWAVDSAVIRQTAMLWWLVMYLGQATKDYLGWPRPPSPPVVHLETQHLAEYSMPSTHAMAGTAIPLLLATLLLERYQLPVLPVLFVCILWCATTCLSRLYLGVHTILDVLCGILYALVVYGCFCPLLARYDHYQQTHPLAPLVVVAASLALCTVCYPSGSKNSAKGDAIIITAVLAGLGVGAWLNYQLGYSPEVSVPRGLPVSAPTLHWLGVSLLQLVVGVAIVLTMKVLVKWLTVRLFSSLYGLDRLDTEHPGVMVGYRYTTYFCLGFTIVFVAPLIFTVLGFGRPGYYQELL